MRVSGVLGEREVIFEFKWWAAAESRVEALGIADGVNEGANATFRVVDVPESAALDFSSVFKAFVKLWALALS